MKKNEKLDNNYQNSCSISLFEICTFLTLLLNSIELFYILNRISELA